MKPYTLFFMFVLLLSVPIFSNYTEVKTKIEALTNEAIVHIDLNEPELNYGYWYNTGIKSGLKSSSVVINMWERKYNSLTPPKYRIRKDLAVLLSISDQLSYEGFKTTEEYWFQQGIRHGLSTVFSLFLNHKPLIN